jgi:dihydrofolate reductase
MRLIAAVSQNWGIGYRGELLFPLPGDKAHFKALTLGQTVLMGRSTFESLPGQRPLPHRRNLVLSTRPDFCPKGVEVLSSLAQLDGIWEDLWVIGGEAVYRQLLTRCREAEITFVEAAPPADRFLPDLDADQHWQLVAQSAPRVENGLTYTFRTYRNLTLV